MKIQKVMQIFEREKNFCILTFKAKREKEYIYSH